MSDRPPDCQLTHVSTDDFDGRRFWYLGAKQLADVDTSFPGLGTFFATLFVCDTTSLSPDETGDFCRELLDRGCGTICCWGPGCDAVEDIYDMEYVMLDYARDDDSIGARRYVFHPMTTQHGDEPLREAAWYFLVVVNEFFVVHHAENDSQWPCKDWLSIVVGDRDDWKDEVLGYLRDPRSCDSGD